MVGLEFARVVGIFSNVRDVVRIRPGGINEMDMVCVCMSVVVPLPRRSEGLRGPSVWLGLGLTGTGCKCLGPSLEVRWRSFTLI
jgi:hypothetical protein